MNPISQFIDLENILKINKILSKTANNNDKSRLFQELPRNSGAKTNSGLDETENGIE